MCEYNSCSISCRSSSSIKRTQVGDLDTPKGIAYNVKSFAASFGTDMGKVITIKSQIKAGDIILWRADRHKGGNINKGAITHVGIAADDGLKHQYDHNTSRGFHYRPHWHASAGTSWFAGIRLGQSGGLLPPEISDGPGGDSYGLLNQEMVRFKTSGLSDAEFARLADHLLLWVTIG